MKTVIIGSGRGSNAEAIIQAQLSQLLGNAEVQAIFSDNEDSGIMQIARNNNIEAQYLDGGSFKSKLDDKAEEVWIDAIMKLKPDLIALAGFR